jgi:hypothetical protein
MYIFTMSLINILALFTGDIRFQGNGYTLWLYNAPSAVGALGLVFGFVGLLGVYDDKPQWVQAFLLFFLFKIFIMMVTGFFDYRSLKLCDSWMSVPEHLQTPNPQMEVLAQNDVCPWARWAYVLGTSIDLGFNVYFFYCVYVYYRQIVVNPPYPIDFGNEKHDVYGRWRMYQVKDPRGEYASADKPPEAPEVVVSSSYGAVEEVRYGPDGMPAEEPRDANGGVPWSL